MMGRIMKLACAISIIIMIFDVAIAADLRFLRSTLAEHFSYDRSVSSHRGNRLALQNYIRSEFNASGLEVQQQNFIALSFSSRIDGTNLIGIKKGRNFGTPKDRVIGLGANYDTADGSPGVDDNGSGMSAMLHVVKHLNFNDNWDNTMVFVAFDAKELGSYSSIGEHGSDYFVQNWWKQFLYKTGTATSSYGFIVLDTIMDYNATAHSQDMVNGYETFFPEAAKFIKSNDNRGDFIMAVSRAGVDNLLANSLNSAWQGGIQSEHRLLELSIPWTNANKIADFVPDLVRSDHFDFWKAGLPAIFVTDTGDLRGKMKCCLGKACDNAQMINDDNIRFLGRVTDAVQATMTNLGRGQYSNSAGRVWHDTRALFLAALTGLVAWRIW